MSSCETCREELVVITVLVDERDLAMESCQTCDTRRWRLAGRPIDLQQALAKVGQEGGRRR